ncbi:MAG: NAD(P)/FAD-dependent oxidoreductase [Myxococcales bacterium]
MSETEFLDVVIVGAGFGGLCTAIKLREAGYQRFAILEKGHEVGGTWRENTYPGAACDVQSHLYSYSFEPKSDWSRRYAPWHEIQSYILKVTQKYELRPFIRFGQEVESAHFEEESGRWRVTTKAGSRISARFFVLATGPLHVPAFPRFKGLSEFRGRVFHSAQWDHGFDLTGKRVASIGTGGSAIQYLPVIAPQTARLHVFQRTPAWVIPRDDRAYSGLEKGLFARVDGMRKLHRTRCYWTNEARILPLSRPRLARTAETMAKAFMWLQVKDPAIRAKLTPDYTIGCKRVLISNDYYPTFNRDNVELVTDAIREFTPHGVVTEDGRERALDAVILGTGFVTDPRTYLRNFACTGLAGQDLREAWREGAEAFYGVTVAGYPNMFQLLGPNSTLGHNSVIFMIEAQVHYALSCMKLVQERGARALSVRPEAQQRFNERLQEELSGTVWNTGCRSWYQQEGGKNFSLWPHSTARFWLATRRVRPADYELLG